MKKAILAGTFAVIILLAGFSSVASARTLDRNDLIEQIKITNTKFDWYPGQTLVIVLALIYLFWELIFGNYQSF